MVEGHLYRHEEVGPIGKKTSTGRTLEIRRDKHEVQTQRAVVCVATAFCAGVELEITWEREDSTR